MPPEWTGFFLALSVMMPGIGKTSKYSLLSFFLNLSMVYLQCFFNFYCAVK